MLDFAAHHSSTSHSSGSRGRLGGGGRERGETKELGWETRRVAKRTRRGRDCGGSNLSPLANDRLSLVARHETAFGDPCATPPGARKRAGTTSWLETPLSLAKLAVAGTGAFPLCYGSGLRDPPGVGTSAECGHGDIGRRQTLGVAVGDPSLAQLSLLGRLWALSSFLHFPRTILQCLCQGASRLNDSTC
jgi:hypothetical protein